MMLCPTSPLARAALPGLALAVAATGLSGCGLYRQAVQNQEEAARVAATQPPLSQQPLGPNETPPPAPSFTRSEVTRAAAGFFGDSSEGIAGAIQRAFSAYGEPVGYIAGEEGGGAFVVGLRYGRGYLSFKNGGTTPVYWQGPTIGPDVGGAATKVFTLVYGLKYTRDLYQRFPVVEGSLYVVAGASINYQRSGNIVLAPIRTGVGVRAGANVGYIHYTPEPSYVPF